MSVLDDECRVWCKAFKRSVLLSGRCQATPEMTGISMGIALADTSDHPRGSRRSPTRSIAVKCTAHSECERVYRVKTSQKHEEEARNIMHRVALKDPSRPKWIESFWG